jgi:hypothetical protein
MRNAFLRDVIAGSAGALVVLALIGLPKDHPAPTNHVPGQVQWQWQGTTRLLPYYTPLYYPPLYYPRSPLAARPTP